MTAKKTRSESTRARIITAAKDCFSEIGVAKSSMEMIATRANTTKPTLYAHFGAKEALFEATVVDISEQLQSPDYLPFSPEEPVKEQLYKLIAAYLDSILEADNEQLIRAIMLEYAGRRTTYTLDIARIKKDVLLNWLTSAKEHKVITSTNIEMTSQLIMSTIEGLIIWPSIMSLEKFDRDERSRLLKNAIDFCVKAL